MNLYSDSLITIEYPSEVLTKGHFRIKFNSEKNKFEELSSKEREHAYYAASFVATTLFENLQPTGTNIVVLENPLRIDVVAQFEKYSHNFLWEPKTISQGDMDKVAASIKDACDYIGVKQPSKEPVDMDKVEKIEEKPKEEKKSQLEEDETSEKEESEKEEKEAPSVDEKVKVIEKNYLLDQLNRGA